MKDVNQPKSRAVSFWILLVLCAPIVVYARTYTFDFVNYDDNIYVYGCPEVLAGLSWDGIGWAFSKPQYGNYDPVMWLSFMASVEIFGNSPAVHHALNVLLHAVNAMLLFALLLHWTGARGKSAVVALLFALHPLHVESVAWISSRKDVLSGFFALLAFGAYTEFVRTRSVRAYLLMGVTFTAGLLSKPMLVTFPFMLLILDWWPLRRIGWGENAGPARISVGKLLIEKVPLVLIAGIAAFVTFTGQDQLGALRREDAFPLAARLTNAAVSYGAYLVQTIWPARLAPFYPHPATVPPAWQWCSALGLLVGSAAIALRARRSHPYLLAGWCWFVITLLPVIGIIQFGLQARADRFTYLPSIGVYLILVWGVAFLAERRQVRAQAITAFTAIALLLFASMTYVQAGRWQNSETLWRYTISVSPNNALAHQNLGIHLMEHGNIDDAEANLQRALELSYSDPYTHAAVGGPTLNALGAVATARGDLTQAIRYYEQGVQLDPNNAGLRGNYGDALLAAGLWPKAIYELQRAVELEPDQARAWDALTFALVQHGRLDEAIDAGKKAVALRPNNAEFRFHLALAEYHAKRYEDSLARLEKILAVDESFAPALALKRQMLTEQRGEAESTPDTGVRE